MNIPYLAPRAVELVVVLLVTLAAAALGRAVARALRQPEVIGEIAMGILIGPAALWLLGPSVFHAILSPDTLGTLKFVAEAALILFLVGLAHELRQHSVSEVRGATMWVVAGAFVPSLLAGAGFAGLVLLDGDPAVRGSTPTPALVLYLAVALSITAVPVLARILTEHGMTTTVAGRLALTAAIAIDSLSWLALSVSIGLSTGRMTGFLTSMAVVVGGGVAALLFGRLLRAAPVLRLCTRTPPTATVLLGVVAVAFAMSMERLGMTAVLGAVLVGLAVPGESSTPWTRPVTWVSTAGKALLPAFFLVTGITVLTNGVAGTPWQFVVLAVLLGVAGKVGGSYLGARLAGQPRGVAMRVGALMNTRGLTELIVLQVGYTVGLITSALWVALLLMALATTALTGPLLRLIDRVDMSVELGGRLR